MEPTGVLEHLGHAVDNVRFWCVHYWKLMAIMLKGTYLTTEKQGLFQKLGEALYPGILAGELPCKDSHLLSLVKEIERLTKKIYIEEMRVQKLRLGPTVDNPTALTHEKSL